MNRGLLAGILALVAMILAGCANTMPEKADLMPDIKGQSAGIYPAALDVIVIGRDKRPDPSVILYEMDNEPVQRLTNRIPPQVLIKDSLVQGLRQQGLNLGDRSDISITVLVKELQAKVTKPRALYESQARTRLQIIVGNYGNVVTLEYNREANKESLTRPQVLFLETMLNDQLTETITKILEDRRLQDAIRGRQ
ncbi:MAG: YajG family lipoprotein [Desulfocapsaceae bacterium]|nr:YajG family lipoprotein [Desulfocapsaceae bacterium]